MCNNKESLSMYQGIRYHHDDQYVEMEVVVHRFTYRQVELYRRSAAHMHVSCHSMAHL